MAPPIPRTSSSASNPHHQLAAVDDVLHVDAPFGEDGPLPGLDLRAPPLLEVAQIWSGIVLAVQHFERDRAEVLIGDSWSCAPDFFVSSDELPSDRWPLVQQDARGVHINFDDGSAGFLQSGDHRIDCAELVRTGRARSTGSCMQITLGAEERFVASVGHALFLIRRTPRPARLPVGRGEVDWLFGGLLTALLFVAFALGVTLATQPYDPRHETLTLPDRFVRLNLQELEKEKKKPGQPDSGEGRRAQGEPGKTGKKEAVLRRAKGPKIAVDQAELNRQIARKSGLLAELDAMTDAGIFASDGLGNEVTAALGGLIGAQLGQQHGLGGLAPRGGGQGGGGDAVGIGGISTRGGRFGGGGPGRRPGVRGTGRSGGSPGGSAGDPIILGALDKSVIDRVVKTKLASIRYCYQRELSRDPELGGKVVVKFTISREGTVSTAGTKASTLGSPAVEACLKKQFLRMRFPKPAGGGIVMVSYPFVFNAAGG